MPLFKLPFEANFPINTPLAGHVQPPAVRSAAGTVVTVVVVLDGALVITLPPLTDGTGVPTGRRVTVVLLEDEGLETTVVLPVEPLLKRIG
jgi:hypothetical protein